MLAHKLLPKWMEATRERVQQMGRRWTLEKVKK
jgi:hypothetical protein